MVAFARTQKDNAASDVQGASKYVVDAPGYAWPYAWWLLRYGPFLVVLVAVAHWCDVPSDISFAPGPGSWRSRIQCDLVGKAKLDLHEAVLLGMACLLPFLLGILAARLVREAGMTDLPDSTAPKALPVEPNEMPGDVAERDWQHARRTVSLEWARRNVVCANAGLHALLWGFLGTFAVSSCAMFWETAHSVRKATVDPGSASLARDADITGAPKVALAVAAAVAISFLLSFAQVLVRSAEHDANTALFSNASRDMVVSAVVAGIAAILFANQGSDSGAIGLGLCAGLLGPRALVPLKERAASVLGVKAPTEVGHSLSLGSIDGLTDDVMDRLAEEGIRSVHALATINTPRIYFGTPYTWERITDWQAQAVLLEELGLAGFAKFREKSPIRGVQDVMRIVRNKGSAADFAKSLGLGSEPEMQRVVDALRESEALLRLEVFGKYGNALLCDVSECRRRAVCEASERRTS